MFRVSRGRRAEDRTLELRMALFIAGAAAGLLGMGLRIDWIVTAGIIVLAAGLLLGIRERRRDNGDRVGVDVAGDPEGRDGA